MTLGGVTFRGCVGPIDADRQYLLWLHATAKLPLAWSSSLTNARALAFRAAQHHGSRIYAERDGQLVGYIGTHPPFDSGDMGLTAPFGYPWTFPHNPALAAELYTRMLESLPLAYKDDKPRAIIQRFRSTWTEQLSFVAARGWTERFRKGIWARRIMTPAAADTSRVQPVTPGDPSVLERLSGYADHDTVLSSRPSVSTLTERAASGWFSLERCWEVENIGAFSFDVRGDWAEVQLFHARDSHAAEMLALLDAAAQAHGATGVYFILGDGEAARIEQLKRAGFSLIDADLYMALNL